MSAEEHVSGSRSRDPAHAESSPADLSPADLTPEQIGAAELQATLERAFPDAAHRYGVEAVVGPLVRVRLSPGPHDIRPGGTVSGPALMELADTAMWMAVLRVTGLRLASVTSDLSIHFLRRPPAGPVWATCALLKRGRRLAVGDVRLFDAADCAGEPVAQATVSYALV